MAIIFNPVTRDYEFGSDDEKTQPDAIVPIPVETRAAIDTSIRVTDASHIRKNLAIHSGNVASGHALLKSADLDWDPVLMPLYMDTPAGRIEVDRKIGRAVCRNDTFKPIGTVGGRYAVQSHRTLINVSDALIKASGNELHNAQLGCRNGGAQIFLQMEGTPRKIKDAPPAFASERADRITLFTSHDGSLLTSIAFGCVWIVCRNTYAMARLKSKREGAAWKHTIGNSDALSNAEKLITEARKAGAEIDNRALRMMRTKLDDRGMVALSSYLIPGDTTRALNERRKLMDAWVSSPGAAPGSAFGALQAVTHYTTHTIPIRGKTDRAANLAIGDGTGSEMQAAAWWALETDEGTKALQTVTLYRV